MSVLTNPCVWICFDYINKRFVWYTLCTKTEHPTISAAAENFIIPAGSSLSQVPPEVILPSPASRGSGMAGSSLRIQLGTLWFSQQVLKVLVIHLVYFYAESTSQWLLLKKLCSLGSEVHVQSTCYKPCFNVLINYFVGKLQIDLYTQCSGWEVRQ